MTSGKTSAPDLRWTLALIALALAAAWALLHAPLADPQTPKDSLFWTTTLGLGVLAIAGIRRLAAINGPAIVATATAGLFGLWIVYFWQLLTVALDVPRVLLPAPTLIGAAFTEHLGTLQTDFVQTVVKAVALGWLLG